MKSKLPYLVAGLFLAILFALLQVVFILREGETVVITRLGRPDRATSSAGLLLRWPWPIERAHRFDNRMRTLNGLFEETLTQDGKNVLVALYAGWRIAEPVRFLERVGSVEQADIALDGLLRTYKNAAVGQYRFAQLVNTDTSALRGAEIEQRVLDQVRPQALERYGIDVAFTGIRRIGLPEAITQSVFARMRAERQELADRYRSEGEGEAIRIRAGADAERDRLLAEAEADARRSRAEGEAEAAASYRVFAQAPDFALFLRKLDAFEDALKEKSTVVLSSDTAPFDLLKSPGTPAPAQP